MADGHTLRVDLFGEDAAHEDCGRALIGRVAAEEDVEVAVRAVSARFGIGRVKRELSAFQATVARVPGSQPDLLVVLADANRVGAPARRKEIEDALDPAVFPSIVVGTPDPYVERWLMADPPSFREQFGVQPSISRTSDRHVWKRRLVSALEDAGQIVLQGGAEFAPDIVAAMDLYRAGRTVPSLGAFIADLRAAIRQPR